MSELNKVPEHLRPIIGKLVKRLEDFFCERLFSVVIFGSIARGDWRSDSDIDILIVADGLPKSRLERQKIFILIEEDLRNDLEGLWDEGYYHDFSPILKTPEEAQKISPLYLDLVEDAIILYDKNDFFKNILLRLKKRLENLGAKRIFIGKKWIWDLKPDYKLGEVIDLE
ncbi:MAG: nucleotidyltransferase domain-containing protein [Candidatus Njordarchaeota archaeon]